MFSPFIIPLAVFAMVVLIVGIVHFARLRDKEMEIHANLHREQMEHQRKMKELEAELERVRKA
jgi:hypothetical protein